MKSVTIEFPLDSGIALIAAMSTPPRKMKGERDTEFVKRIVGAYCASLVIDTVIGASQPTSIQGAGTPQETGRPGY